MTHQRLILYIPFILMAFLMLTGGKPGFAQSTVSDAWQKNIPRKAAALKEAAKVLIEQRDYQGAVAKLEQSLVFKEDYYLAIYNLAVAYALRGTELQAPSASDRTRAWRELGKAQTIAEAQGIKDAALYTTMGWLASMEAIFSQPEAFARRTAWYDAAQRYWESALNIDAASTDALNNLGVLYELRGDFERALEYYEKAKALKDAKGEGNHRRLQLPTQSPTRPFASTETRDRRALLILFEDKFNRDELGELYEVLDPDPNRLTLNDGKLVIVATNPVKNRVLLEKTFSGDFVATVRMNMQVTAGNAAGLYYWVDVDNLLSFRVYGRGEARPPVMNRLPENIEARVPIFTKVVSGESYQIQWSTLQLGKRNLEGYSREPELWYFQLERKGVNYTARLSVDGSQWTTVGTHTFLPKDGRLGFGATSGQNGIENAAEFGTFVVQGGK